MKLHAQAPSNLNSVTGYGPGYIDVNRTRYAGSLILSPQGPAQALSAATFEQVRQEHFATVLAQEPEVVLIGTGAAQRFLPPLLTLPLARAGVGFEVMDTAAACRTFNILVAEGRRVVGVFLNATPAPAGDADA